MLQDPPAGGVLVLAKAIYAANPRPADMLVFVAFSFILSRWASSRVSVGANGWIRHLPATEAARRRSLLAAVVCAQIPLAAGLVLLAVVASRAGLSLTAPVVRSLVVVTAAAMGSLPVRRRALTTTMGIVAALVSAWPQSGVFLSLPILVAVDAVSGSVEVKPAQKEFASRDLLLGVRIAFRAVGWRILPAVGFGALAQAAGWLVIANNQLSGTVANAAGRLAGSMACVLCLFSLAKDLAVCRPPWPFSRSLPWSTGRRTTEDASWFVLCTLPLLLLIPSVPSLPSVLALVPLLTIRAAEYVRRIPARRTAALVFLFEGTLVACFVTVFPLLTALICVTGAIPAWKSARRADSRQRTTAWFELHHAGAGDTGSWSGS